ARLPPAPTPAARAAALAAVPSRPRWRSASFLSRAAAFGGAAAEDLRGEIEEPGDRRIVLPHDALQIEHALRKALDLAAADRNHGRPGLDRGQGGGLGAPRLDDGLRLLTQIVENGFHRGGVERVPLLESAEEQKPRAQRVDAPGNAARVLVDETEGVVRDLGIALPAHEPEPVLDVGPGLGGIHRAQMGVGGDALAELLELLAGKGFPELRLPQQERLEQGARPFLEVGEHAQLFERAHGKVLRLVDDEGGALSLPVNATEEGLQASQQRRL